MRSRGLPALLLPTLILLAAPALAQDRGGVAGRVTDKKTGHALPFATITVVGAQRGGLTDSEGQYQISGVPPGTWEVKAQFLGYGTISKPGVVVGPGRTVAVDFQLEEIVVRQEKVIEVTAERRLVEVKQGTTIRSVNAGEIRNLAVQTVSDVLQQQAGISTEADQIHVRGGRADETVFVINGVANRDLVTGQSTAGQLNARSVAEVNVATGAYDVRYGNALSGVVEIKLKEGGDKLSGGFSTASGSYGGRSGQLLIGGPDLSLRVLGGALVGATGATAASASGAIASLGVVGLAGLASLLPGSTSSIVDLSGSLFDTRFPGIRDVSGNQHLRSSYRDELFDGTVRYGDLFTPSEDNRWALRYGMTWKPNNRDKWLLNFSKRIAVDQGFSRTFINATGDAGDPSYPWEWAHRIAHAPTIFEDNVQSSLEWRRTLSTTGYTNFQISRYFQAQRQDVQGKNWTQYEEPDDRSLGDSTDVRRADFFIDSGDDNTWQDRRSTIYELQWSLVQRLHRHEVEVGVEHQFQTVQYVTIQDPWVYDPNGLGGAHDLWKAHPWMGDFYVRDRLEYEGFTANFGLRADYWFVGREAERAVADTANHNVTAETRDAFYRDTDSFFGRRYKLRLSPRVIVAHPITESSSFFFNYGEFTQIPSYRYVFSKMTSISSESFPLLGNPNLNPQVSVNYEVGAKHQFLPTAAANLTFFVKDVYDYPSATTFKRSQGASLVDIFVYLNGHFARSKGFEIELEKRRSHYWAGKLTYTFQETKGKSSDPNEQRVVQENGGDAAETRLSETFVSWNRPHKLAASLDLRFDNETPTGFAFLKQAGVNFYVQGQSGRAYTPSNPLSTQAAEPFSKNAPVQVTTDLRVNRWFKIGGQRLDLGVSGTNVFNNYSVNRVDPVTGLGRIWGKGSYDPVLFPTVNDFVRTSDVDDPSNYGPGAQWRFTLDYDF